MSGKTISGVLELSVLLALVVMSTGCSQMHEVVDRQAIVQRPVSFAFTPARSTLAQPRAADFVIYEQEWKQFSAQLNQAGRKHVHQLAELAAEHESAIIVEPATQAAPDENGVCYTLHGDPMLDSRRRQMLVEVLDALGIPNAEERVFIATPFAPGI